MWYCQLVCRMLEALGPLKQAGLLWPWLIPSAPLKPEGLPWPQTPPWPGQSHWTCAGHRGVPLACLTLVSGKGRGRHHTHTHTHVHTHMHTYTHNLGTQLKKFQKATFPSLHLCIYICTSLLTYLHGKTNMDTQRHT